MPLSAAALNYALKRRVLEFLPDSETDAWLCVDAELCAEVVVNVVIDVKRHASERKAPVLTDACLSGPQQEVVWLRRAADILCCARNGWQRLVVQRDLRHVFGDLIPAGTKLFLSYDPRAAVSRLLLSMWSRPQDTVCCTSVHLLGKPTEDMTAERGTLPGSLELVRCDNTALECASLAGHSECLEAMYRAGAWWYCLTVPPPLAAEAAPSYSYPLHTAAREGHVACVKLLLKIGMDVNAVVDGDSALYLATIHDHATCADLLRDNGGRMIHDARVWA